MSSRSGSEGRRPGLVSALVILLVTVGIGVGGGLAVYEVADPAQGQLVHIPAGDGGTIVTDVNTIVFLALGGFAGLVVGYATLGVPWARRILNALLGVYVGALAGAMVYVMGYVTAVSPSAWTSWAEFQTVAAQSLFTVSPWLILTAGLGALIGLIVERYAWRFQGLLAFVSLSAVIFGFIGYSLFVTLPEVPSQALPLSITLFLAETGLLLLVLVYAFYPLDVFWRKRWDRVGRNLPFDPEMRPKVAFHVPIYNEPPEMVKDTLRSLLDVQYPRDRYEIMVLDDSTDEEAVEAVRDFCRDHGITYLHRGKRDGFKAGALNVGLEYTGDDVDLIAVIDADYQVDPDYLQHMVGYFVDDEVGFVQTPQDYRNQDHSFLTKYYYYADSYFYQAVLPSRNEANAIIFCGTMGIVDKEALEEIDGWSNDHVTEDAELATRMHGAGYKALYINESFGRGLIPESYEGYRAQHHRWALGGGQLLRTRLSLILSRRFSLRQKVDHLAGIVHWYDGLFILTIAVVLSLLGLGDLFGYNVAVHHQRSIWLVGLVPIFLLVEAITRTQLALGHHFELSLGESVRVMGMWLSIKFSNTWGAIKGLLGLDITFARTPKETVGMSNRREAARLAAEAAPFETGMASVMWFVALAFTAKTVALWAWGPGLVATRLFLVLWLTLFALGFTTAPLYAYLAHRGAGVDEDEPDAGEPAPQAPTSGGEAPASAAADASGASGASTSADPSSASGTDEAGEPPDDGAPAFAAPDASGASGVPPPSDPAPRPDAGAYGAPPPSDPPSQAEADGDPPDDEPSPWRLPTGWSLAGLAALLVLALALRLRDPLSTFVIGAEDPYVHMARTWDLVQMGKLPEGYPPGFMFLLAPAALLGTDAFYWFSRFIPPFLGVVEVLGMFLFCRYMLDEAAGFAGGFLAAVMPENIMRTTLLFPTALTLAVLPFGLLFLFRGFEGHRESWHALAALTFLLLVTHPWGLGLAAPPILAYWFVTADENRATVAGISALVAASVVATFYVLPGTWNPFPSLFENVHHKAAFLAAHPSTLWTNLPVYVNPPAMLTYPAIAAGALGAGVAAVRRTRLGTFALCWTLLTLPIVLVHWFGMWFLPHRTVVFMGLGVAMLGAVLFHALARGGPGVSRTRRATGLALAGVLVVSTVPAAAETSPWYRIYDEQDYEFWNRLDELDPSLVIAPTWETKAGYRALTGNPAIHDELFFYDRDHREWVLSQDPGLFVVYDSEFADDVPSGFLQDWVVREKLDTATAYQPPPDGG